MAVSMAAFTTNDSITKVVSSEMNFGQVMLVRGLFAIRADRGVRLVIRTRCVRCAR